MPFNLGGFASGAAEGLEEGQDIREKYRKMADEQKARIAQVVAGKAETALASPTLGMNGVQALAGLGGGQQPQPVAIPGAQPMPGAPLAGASGPPAPPPATPAQMPGVTPQQPPPGPTGGMNGAQAVAGIGKPPPQPQQPQQPQGGNPADPASGSQFMQQFSQMRQQSQAKLKGIFQAVLQAGGPEMKKHPEIAFQAVQQILEQDKTLEDSDKAYLTAELKLATDESAMLRTFIQQQGATGRADQANETKLSIADQAHGDRVAKIAESWKAVQAAQAGDDRRAAARDATTLQAEDLRQAGADQRSDDLIQFREQALAAGLDEKEWQAQLGAALKEQGMSDAFIAKIFGSEESNAPAGQGVPAPPRVETPLPSAPARGGAPAGGSASPPVKGARKAPDKNWYIPDPKRPGKYQMVTTEAP